MPEFTPHGVMPVLEVPFHDDEAIDYSSFENVIRNTVAAGADAVMFPAFASEYLKLAPHERATLEGQLLTISETQKFPVVISVQEHATRLAAAAAEKAVQSGAAVINLLPPHQLRVSAAQMRRHLREVLIASDPAPIILQYAPAETGTSLDLHLIADLCETHPNLWGVKVDSSPAGPMIDALNRLSGTVGRSVGTTVGYAGLHLVDCVSRGASAVQPGCSFTEIYVKLWRLLTAGPLDAGERLHRDLLPYLNHWMQSVELIVAAEKAISHLRGWISTPTTRQPGVRLDDREQGRVDRFLAEFDPYLRASAH